MAKKPKALNVENLSAIDADLGVVVAGDTPEQEPEPAPAGRVVVWTKLGEERRAKSEHGFHKEGDEVLTEHADHFIQHGFAVEG
jgi:hypothetical protein